MAYSYTNTRGTTYFLHAKKSISKTGKERTLYFFAKTIKDGSLDAVPAGYEVIETKNGLPVLKRKAPAF